MRSFDIYTSGLLVCMIFNFRLLLLSESYQSVFNKENILTLNLDLYIQVNSEDWSVQSAWGGNFCYKTGLSNNIFCTKNYQTMRLTNIVWLIICTAKYEQPVLG